MSITDLVSPTRNVTSILRRDLEDEVLEVSEEVVNERERVYERELQRKLSQILTQLAELAVELVVFPEASITPATLSVLVGHRNSVAAFAGIGYIRHEDLVDLNRVGIADAHQYVGMNAAVFIPHSGPLRVVTKRYGAQGEILEAGEGRTVEQFTATDGQVWQVGLSICMDYLREGNTSSADLECVAALTRTTRDFIPAVPRTPLVLANHAGLGGSVFSAAQVSGAEFVTESGVQPLPLGAEGAIVVEWEGLPSQPKSLEPVHNRLVARAALLYDDTIIGDSGELQGSSSLAREMAQWVLDDFREGALHEQIRTAADYARDNGANRLLVESLERLARIRPQVLPRTLADLQIYTIHFRLKEVNSPPEFRYKTLERLRQRWVYLLTDGDYILGSLIDSVVREQKNLRSALPRGRAVALAGGRTESARRTPTTGRQVLTHLRLGTYRGEDAARTLADQAQVLRILASYAVGSVELEYRLWTERSSTGELVPFFDALVVGTNLDEPTQREIGAALGSLLRLTFRRGWNLTALELIEPSAMTTRAKARLAESTSPLVGDDWSFLVDYLRTLDGPSAVRLVVSPSGTTAVADIPESPILSESDSAPERMAAATFSRTARQEQRQVPALQLEARVESETPLGTSVLSLILGRLFGPQELLTDDAPSSPATALTPAQVLRVAHPPYGAIEGRGLIGSRFSLALPTPPPIVPGVVIGTADAMTSKSDIEVKARLTDEARLQHLYVLGRTGSGKTNLLKNLARQDIAEGRGVAVIDPHGDLVDYLLGHVGDRKDEVLLLDFGDQTNLPVLNPLDLDVDDDSARSLAIEDFIRLVTRQSFHEFYGPRFEALVRLALKSITAPEYPLDASTVVEVSRLLRTEERRKWASRFVRDQDIASEWQNFDRQGTQEAAQVLNWALSKFSEMSGDHILGQVFGGGASTVSIYDVVASSGILLVTIPEWEMSRSASRLLGSFVQERLRKAVYRRGRTDGARVRPYFLYVDEFQNFATTDFDEMVAEARKFGLGLTLANQNLRQLEDFSRFSGSTSRRLLEAVLGNVSNMAMFGSSREDNRYLAEHLSVESSSIERLPRFVPLVRALIGGEQVTFTARVPDAGSDPGLPQSRREVRDRQEANGVVLPRILLSERVDAREHAIERFVAASRPKVETPSWRKPSSSEGGGSSFLDEWREKMRAAGTSGSADRVEETAIDGSQESGSGGPEQEDLEPGKDVADRDRVDGNTDASDGSESPHPS